MLEKLIVIGGKSRHQVYREAGHKEFGEEVLADISLVSDQFAENLFDEGFVTQGLAVIDIARREHEIQEVALLVADEMQLEAVEPAFPWDSLR